MQRRTLLAGVACSTIATAGCLSVAESAVERNDTAVEPPSDPEDPIARAVLGSSEDQPPHRVRLWNLDDERYSVDLEIESDDGSTSFSGSYDLAPDAHVVVFLHDPDEYDVAVTVDGETVSTPTLEASSFDDPCPATDLFVLEDGDLEVTTAAEADHC